MNRQNIILLFTLSLLLGLAQTALPVGSNPVCPSKATLDLVQSNPAILDFDETSLFYRPDTDDSVQLFVKYGTASDNFKFKIYDDQYQNIVKQKQCQSTSGANWKFVALTHQVLILEDSGTQKYYACRYDELEAATTLPRAELSVPGTIPVPFYFVPYYWNDVDRLLFVAITRQDSTLTKGGHFKYIWPATITTGTTTISADSRGALFNHVFPKMQGTSQIFYDQTDNVVYKFDGATSYASAASDFPITAGQLTTVHQLASKFCGISILSADSKSGTLYMVTETTISQTVTLPALSGTTRIYEPYSDEISSLLFVSNNFFYWGNLDPNVVLRSKKLTTNSEIDTTNLKFASLSSNKAVLLYANKIDYYRITGTQATTVIIEFLFTKSVTMSFQNAGQYRFGLSCMCAGVRRFACFSSTLNCIIVKKADVSCSTIDDPFP